MKGRVLALAVAATASMAALAAAAQSPKPASPPTMPQAKGAMKADDATITSRVKAALQSNRSLDAKQVKVETKGGKVTLQGQMPRAQIDQAVKIAKGIDGVTGVDNQLKPGAG
jgi:hyperosmotically inducible protein